MKYYPNAIETRWSEIWEKTGLNRPNLKSAKKPYYNLMMYPYPSAEGLHVGNMYAFTGSDIWGRYMRARGQDVFEPIGVDSGGIHSENFAIKQGVHPKVLIPQNISNFTKQLKKIGNMFDWDSFVDVMQPEYYRWTQWIFTELFKAGLAVKKSSLVTWCPSCQTTLSDEQTETKDDQTVCERCKTPIVRKKMKQWFFRITDYAERLLTNLDQLDWVDKVKTAQRNWIGKAQGIEIEYPLINHQGKLKIKNLKFKIKVFTTRPDTNFGATFIVLAPEHPLVDQITTNDNKTAVNDYIDQALIKTEQERVAEGREKTGVFTGAYVTNPLNNARLPVYISDFVLYHVGTGAVVGVPGHDRRDFEFTQKFNLPVIRVVTGPEGKSSPIRQLADVWEGEGKIINSGFLNGLPSAKAKKVVMDVIEGKSTPKKGPSFLTKKWGQRQTIYRLRDWCISRQRYWGPPIPMIYCQRCEKQGISYENIKHKDKKIINHSQPEMPGWFPVPADQLPVLLPDINDYLPDGSGKAPLARHPEFYRTKCPYCGSPAIRETDVSDTFLDSSWYFLRYPTVSQSCRKQGPSLSYDKDGPCGNSESWDPQLTKKWLPVEKYIGGAEHSVLHLMYSRFITMVMHDLGYLDFEEPFTSFYAHGLIIKDGAKMSKSRGNVVNPDDYIAKYGSDALRCYLMFLGPLNQGGDFRDTGMYGMYRFLTRVWKLVNSTIGSFNASKAGQDDDKTRLFYRHKTIQKVTNGIERYKYNTSIAAIMEFVNFLEEKTHAKLVGGESVESVAGPTSQIGTEDIRTLLLLLAPFAPHMTEELWQTIANKNQKNTKTLKLSNSDNLYSIHSQPWPEYDEKYLAQEQVDIVIQVNGKKRDIIRVESGLAKDKGQVVKLALSSSKVRNFLGSKKPKKEIYIPGRLINLVV
jgi:leucyl-tRNA synthetase